MIKFILLFVLFSCNTIQDEFKPYLKEFIKESNGIIKTSQLDGLGIELVERDGFSIGNSKGYYVIGECMYLTKSIKIDRITWKRGSELSRKALLFHELGHCICLERHDNRKKDSFCPESIMNSSIPPFYCLLKYEEEYKKDFFRRCK